MTRETVGKIASDLLPKELETIDLEAQQQGMQEKYLEELIKCVEIHTKIFASDFFVVVLGKIESRSGMSNVSRNYFAARLTCPTPNYDQDVYKYNKKDENIEYIWSIPDRISCIYMTQYPSEVPLTHAQLLKFVMEFKDGTLYKLAKKLNGEELNSSLMELE